MTSPGGTTIAAVHALECGGMRAAVINAAEESLDHNHASRMYAAAEALRLHPTQPFAISSVRTCVRVRTVVV